MLMIDVDTIIRELQSYKIDSSSIDGETYNDGLEVAISVLSCLESPPLKHQMDNTIWNDGTLVVSVPVGSYKNVKRVLVLEDKSHNGGLYYPDGDDAA